MRTSSRRSSVRPSPSTHPAERQVQGERSRLRFIAVLGATPRIPPGDASEIGRLNVLFARVAGAVTGTEPPKVFTTLARHRRLFRRWLWFAGALMPRGVLRRAE